MIYTSKFILLVLLAAILSSFSLGNSEPEIAPNDDQASLEYSNEGETAEENSKTRPLRAKEVVVEDFCAYVSKRKVLCGGKPRSFEETSLFRNYSMERVPELYNEFAGWHFPQDFPLEVRPDPKNPNKTVVMTKKDLNRWEVIGDIGYEFMIRDNICQEHFFKKNHGKKCAEQINLLNLTEKGEAFAFGALYHMANPQISRISGLLLSMQFDVNSIPVLNLTLEETAVLQPIPGTAEPLKLRAKLVTAYHSLKSKLSKVYSRDSVKMFGRGKPPIQEMLGVLAYVEIFGYIPGGLPPHLVPFHHLLKVQDSEESSANGKASKFYMGFNPNMNKLKWLAYKNFMSSEEYILPLEKPSGTYFAKQGLTDLVGFEEDCVPLTVFNYEDLDGWSEAKRFIIFGIGLNLETCFSKGDKNRLAEKLELFEKVTQASESQLSIVVGRNQGLYGDDLIRVIGPVLKDIKPNMESLLGSLEQNAILRKEEILKNAEGVQVAFGKCVEREGAESRCQTLQKVKEFYAKNAKLYDDVIAKLKEKLLTKENKAEL